MKNAKASIVIPALNEERSIGMVLSRLPRRLVKEVVVGDNGSSDNTAREARRHGARVVSEPRKGYGSGCQAALRALKDPEIVVIMDADGADESSDLAQLLEPIRAGRADFVLGSREMGTRQEGSLGWHQRAGNLLACFLMRLATGFPYTDCGPFRAMRADAFKALAMSDPNFGWNIEMQMKAVQAGLRVMEVPVTYHRRVGVSKISGTVSGTVKAGTKILYSVARYWIRPFRGPAFRAPSGRVVVREQLVDQGRP